MSARAPFAPEPAAALGASEFEAAMAALGPWEGSPRLAAAVSGGADSLALAEAESLATEPLCTT